MTFKKNIFEQYIRWSQDNLSAGYRSSFITVFRRILFRYLVFLIHVEIRDILTIFNAEEIKCN